MPVDLEALKRSAARLQRIIDLAENDPDLVESILQYATKSNNGNGVKAAPVADSKPNGAERPRGYFIGAIGGAILDLHGEFTSSDVEKVIRDKGVEIVASNANVAINDALGTLEKRGQVMRCGKRGVQVLWKKSISAIESRTA